MMSGTVGIRTGVRGRNHDVLIAYEITLDPADPYTYTS